MCKSLAQCGADCSSLLTPFPSLSPSLQATNFCSSWNAAISVVTYVRTYVRMFVRGEVCQREPVTRSCSERRLLHTVLGFKVLMLPLGAGRRGDVSAHTLKNSHVSHLTGPILTDGWMKKSDNFVVPVVITKPASIINWDSDECRPANTVSGPRLWRRVCTRKASMPIYENCLIWRIIQVRFDTRKGPDEIEIGAESGRQTHTWQACSHACVVDYSNPLTGY